MARSGLVLAFLYVISVCGRFVFPTHLKSEDWTDYLEHNKRISQFPCSVPTPTVVRVRKIHPDAVQIPWETVLHRCKGSGCCPIGKTCQSSDVQRVELTFLVRNIITNETKLEKMFMVNDTKCVCGDYRS